MELLRLQEAAELVGVSYQTLKQWIYKGKIRSVKTAGGHHRIPRDEIERLVGTGRSPKKKRRIDLGTISGGNKLFGRITEMRYEGLLVQISIEISGQILTSIITRDAARELGLREGPPVYALLKSTEVMVVRG